MHFMIVREYAGPTCDATESLSRSATPCAGAIAYDARIDRRSCKTSGIEMRPPIPSGRIRARHMSAFNDWRRRHVRRAHRFPDQRNRDRCNRQRHA
ncbi:hypothetical protein HMPREF0762_01499 [Slackia exigua ATCC 700122]|uniref:Uncharacterized protein n=1 Tax=Slackia exigua (strain ATCC 700122 / DSM 15923 / CIP 105133 / JCM 11022 / KCTC 5966 / S-7) TaxID=649764 RepID=D0WI27_SLAES|nr:hypothetical protein HMPREF0762_01499 [Slackia exigua ATCC 700122]